MHKHGGTFHTRRSTSGSKPDYYYRDMNAMPDTSTIRDLSAK